MQKHKEFVETRFHELEHESNMRLLEAYSHTSERRGYEAVKECQKKRGTEGGLSVRGRENVKEHNLHNT